LFYIFAVSGLSVLGIIMAGWGSGNKYALLGGLRSAAQAVSYEIPRALSIVPILMFAGSMKLTAIVHAQSGFWFLGGVPVLPRWFIFYPVVGQLAFLIFLICSVAETNRTPFDMAEAESELVSGFHTEYSGMKFAFFFLAEYAYVFLSSGMAAALFLGGGMGPVLPSWAWFLIKTFAIVFLFLWFRWTFPRLRIDRLMEFSWKFLLPWSVFNILAAGFAALVW
jgi:NADH-quinone oxidoreductase subunit H